MHGDGSARSERVRHDVFWGNSDSGRAHLTGLDPEDCDDVQGADRAEPLAEVRVAANQSGPWASMFYHAEEDVGAQ